MQEMGTGPSWSCSFAASGTFPEQQRSPDRANERAKDQGIEPSALRLHALRWVEAWEAGMAPRVVLEATNAKVLEIVPLEALKRHALDLH